MSATATPELSPLEFCGNETCCRIVVRENDTRIWTHWGDGIRECLDGNLARPGGRRLPVRRRPPALRS